MKSYALTLAAALSLAGATSYAEGQATEGTDVMKSDPKAEAKYWESRPVEGTLVPTAANSKDAKKAAAKTEKVYWEARDPRSSEPYNTKVAQAPEDVPPEALPPGNVPPADRDHTYDRKDLLRADPEVNRRGISIEAGGGVGGFIDSGISEITSPQGQWTARAVFGTRSHFAGEAAYVGSAQSLSPLGGDARTASIVGNGGEGLFRLNVLTGMWQPYVAGGIGFMHYQLGGTVPATADVQTSGDVATFPIGAGMAFRMNQFVLDNRVSFHPATWSTMVRNTNLSTWDVQVKAGFEF